MKDQDSKLKSRLHKQGNSNSYTAKDAIDKYFSFVIPVKICRGTKQFNSTNAKKLEEGKWRCAVCGKLFRAEEFVVKHLGTHFLC